MRVLSMHRPGMVNLPVFFTLIVLPKAWVLPAFRAGLMRVLSMHRPGMVNLPVFFTSVVASAAKSSMIFEHSDFFSPLFAAKVSAMPVFVMALADTAFFFIAFMAFTIAREIERALKWICPGIFA